MLKNEHWVFRQYLWFERRYLKSDLKSGFHFFQTLKIGKKIGLFVAFLGLIQKKIHFLNQWFLDTLHILGFVSKTTADKDLGMGVNDSKLIFTCAMGLLTMSQIDFGSFRSILTFKPEIFNRTQNVYFSAIFRIL